jgi:hypothetical protein
VAIGSGIALGLRDIISTRILSAACAAVHRPPATAGTGRRAIGFIPFAALQRDRAERTVQSA